MTLQFDCTFSILCFARPPIVPRPDWVEIEGGPGLITLPENQEYGIRIHNIDDQDLKRLAVELAPVQPLTYLNLSENRKITQAGMVYLKDFHDLVYLNLSSCGLTNEGMAHLQGLSHLETLDLSFCNRLTGPALKYLQHLPRLAHLNLQGCIKITNGDVARFKKRGLVIKK